MWQIGAIMDHRIGVFYVVGFVTFMAVGILLEHWKYPRVEGVAVVIYKMSRESVFLGGDSIYDLYLDVDGIKRYQTVEASRFQASQEGASYRVSYERVRFLPNEIDGGIRRLRFLGGEIPS